jgi:hypothetical protein
MDAESVKISLGLPPNSCARIAELYFNIFNGKLI